AHAFAKECASVSLNYVRASAVKVATQILGECGVKADTIQGDVSAEGNCVRMVNGYSTPCGGTDNDATGWTRISGSGDLNALGEANWDK
ncbi:hypothetical protein HOY82DRAFT_469395, partial [Tuber indicum]